VTVTVVPSVAVPEDSLVVASVGVSVGDAVGGIVGDVVGDAVGEAVGEAVSDAVGFPVVTTIGVGAPVTPPFLDALLFLRFLPLLLFFPFFTPLAGCAAITRDDCVVELVPTVSAGDASTSSKGDSSTSSTGDSLSSSDTLISPLLALLALLSLLAFVRWRNCTFALTDVNSVAKIRVSAASKKNLPCIIVACSWFSVCVCTCCVDTVGVGLCHNVVWYYYVPS